MILMVVPILTIIGLSVGIIFSDVHVEDDLLASKNRILETQTLAAVDIKLTNLFDPSFKSLGKFDFIFSRNMLIYFDKETKLKAKKILEDMRKNDKQAVFFGHADLF